MGPRAIMGCIGLCETLLGSLSLNSANPSEALAACLGLTAASLSASFLLARSSSLQELLEVVEIDIDAPRHDRRRPPQMRWRIPKQELRRRLS